MAVGVGALPIVSLITFFVGVIIALQGAYELQRLGAMQLVASLVSISITRELGPLITAIVVIGRSGSAFAAEIGTMRVTEELDALETMALDPSRVSGGAQIPGHGRHDALPRRLVGLHGRAGRLPVRSGQRQLHVRQLRDCHARRPGAHDITTGIVKALVFGLVITAVGCQEGFSTGAGAEEVGRSTTSAVVISILLVILIDLVFTTLFYLARGTGMAASMAAPAPPAIVISARDLRVQYGDREVLHGLTFEIVHGETVVVIGGSGSGKSTLLRTLVGLEKPSSGEVRVKGVDIAKASAREMDAIRKKIGLAFQGGALIGSLPVGENIALPLLEHTT
jgi:phospholipid/cholesterol/gamma-HCH transport system permease protein